MQRSHKIRILIALALILTALFAMSCGAKSRGGAAVRSTKLIAYIPMDSTDLYWKAIEDGIKEAAAEEKKNGRTIRLERLAPKTKDTDLQNAEIKKAIDMKADLVILAPCSADGVSRTISAATDLGLKFIYVDSPASAKVSGLVANENFEAGIKAGRTMMRLLGEEHIRSGRIGILSAQKGVSTCEARIEGFKSVFEGTPFVILDPIYTVGNAGRAQKDATLFIDKRCVGIFCANEGTSIGAGRAAAVSGKKICVGAFGNTPEIRKMVKSRDIAFTMDQDPRRMGRKALNMALRVLDGRADDPDMVEYIDVSVVGEDDADEYADR